MIRTVAIAVTTAVLAATTTLAADKPNIVYILADDLGFGDLGCYGQKKLTTPHIDLLAAEGIKMTRHYAGSTVCAPSRCVLMTGLHTGHCTVRGNGRAVLKDADFTAAEFLKKHGYTTGCFGKWGIGNPPPLDDPNRQGFDEFFGYVNMFHAHNFYPEFLVQNGKKLKLRNVVKQKFAKFRGDPARDGAGVAREKLDYAPDLIADEALKFIDDNHEKPFFLYFALNIPHANNEGGGDEDRARGMEVPEFGEFANQDWPAPEKGFATMIRRIDDYTGRVMAKLKQHGLDKNTLVIFSSDNGPHQEGRHQMEFFDSNGTLRGMKRDLYEGGVRVPMIARWPGMIPPGTSSDHLSGFHDFLPTLSDLLGGEVLETDGISMMPAMTGIGSQARHKYLYWEFAEQGGKIGVTDGKWKAVRLNTLKKQDAPMQLFDLEADPAEEKDVAKQHPEIVKKMEQRMKAAHRDL